LEAGAGDKINQKDWNGKSAMHYAVVGKDVLCPAINSGRVEPIIKNKGEKTELVLSELEINVKEILLTYPNVQTNLRHLRTYLQDYKSILPQKHKDFSKSINEIISNVLSDTKISSQDKSKVLLQKMISERDQLIKHFDEIVNHDTIIDIKI